MESDFRLIIAGDNNNSYGVQLKKQVKELNLIGKVEFLGHIEGAAKQELYANSYFSIVPSYTENFGNVVIESLAQGTPVIASTGTPWAILVEKQAGFWTNNTSRALAQAIDQVLDLPTQSYKLYRDNALNLVRQQFDIQQNIEVWTTTYRNTIM